MSGDLPGDSADAFATLLRGLKDRSGLSYGTLAKRLHMSTSTLHRYCNGTAVPTDYAPVERLARLCKASPQELVELHRAWILADAGRGRKATPSAALEATPSAAQGATPSAAQGATPRVAQEAPGTAGDPEPPAASPEAPASIDLPGAAEARPHPRPRRKRTVLIAGIAVAAVLGAVALTVNLKAGDKGGGGAPQAAGATAAGERGTTDRAPSTSPSASPSPSKSASRSAGPPASASASARTGAPPAAPSRTTGGADGGTTGTPLTVTTRPYAYESPCSQHFLVDSEPAQVGPPASEPEAPRWAAAYGAVSSREQRVALTVQGTGHDTVVLEALHVRVVSSNTPLAWNDYSMGVGCGGGVGTKSFDVNLDAGSPTASGKNGQRDFPYKVSESDPEVFYVTAHTTTRDIRWDLSLEWSSGNRHGTVHIDNAGTPFRTSADTGRPGYDYPLGNNEWVKREEQSAG
ncbi:helix-turn-helix domain-containing protein [Streptomyces sp. NPDC016845]|uniref:helix-turn-helix domain-containing protein n=1 Tax=Streptomyces sp. NPDC016845 TaxID=3364972 RepID=UPI003793B0E0